MLVTLETGTSAGPEVTEVASVTNLNSKLAFLCQFVDEHRNIANAHLVNFVTENLWEILVPATIQKSILALTDEEWFAFLEEHYYQKVYNGNLQSTKDCPTSYSFDKANLLEFVCLASQCRLEHLGVCTSLESFCASSSVHPDDRGQMVKSGPTRDRLLFDPYAPKKKTHEVETLAELLLSLHKNNNFDLVIDIGSGKGYLGSFLALQHGIDVLGIDSSSNNTHGAEKRNVRLQKSWTGLVHRATQRSKESGQREMLSHNSFPVNDRLPVLHSPAATNNHSNTTGKYTSVTQYIDEQLDLEKFLEANGGGTAAKTSLVGLHTCGNLAARMFELYARSPTCHVMCSIGCCYHLMEEEFSPNPYLKSGENPKEKPGFPLSKFLRDKKFVLGRNARMLACQALDRIVADKTVPSPVLFYRSLLQVILRDIRHGDYESVHVGRVAGRSCSFQDYAQKALKKMGQSETISNEEIKQYLHSYQQHDRWMRAFCRIRNLLSPAIESLILLDRLCFVLEQENIKEAHLVRVFDPVISPRCYGIISSQ